ncbi:MAG: amidohydrolase family protein, partial [Alphaproteobacteria bacterium]|nr:amidohydrolase family protein [Alphaproteobacteria bacterium]
AAPGREVLARDALPADHAQALAPHRAVATVFIEALAVDPVAEAVEAQGWAAADPSVCTGIVAHCPLDAPDVADRLDRLAAGTPNLRGIRDIVSWRPGAPSFARRGDLLADPAFERGLRVLAARGLVFDLMLLPHQMADAVRLAARLPDLTVVVEHAGSPEDRSDAGLAAWRAGMAALARLPNVAVKLSALQAVHPPGDAAGIAATIDRLVDLFGCGRLAVGTDFPVHDRHCPATEAIDVFRRHVAGFSADEQRAVFHDTACRLYRLAPRDRGDGRSG